MNTLPQFRPKSTESFITLWQETAHILVESRLSSPRRLCHKLKLALVLRCSCWSADGLAEWDLPLLYGRHGVSARLALALAVCGRFDRRGRAAIQVTIPLGLHPLPGAFPER
jgi:hypothetical protein